MRRIIAVAACVSTLVLARPASADEAEPVVLEVGDKAPKFEGRTDEDKPWKSKDHVGKKILVVYFYPKDMTPGCTKQACNYRDAHKKFAEKEVEVIGVSGDTVESHQEFKEKEKLNFTLLADPEGKIAEAFGVELMSDIGPKITERWTYVIDRDGKIAHKDDEVDAAKDTANVAEVVAKLAEEKPKGEKPKS